MQRISVFDMLKIGVGPSSSHTMGPWRAAERFLGELQAARQFDDIGGLQIDLFGSLAKTGRGHGTDRAVLMGLMGADPATCQTDNFGTLLERVRAAQTLTLLGRKTIAFNPDVSLIFHFDQTLPYHPNGIRLTAYLSDGDSVSATYYSVGGGFIVQEGEMPSAAMSVTLPHPCDSAEEVLKQCQTHGLALWQMVLENEQRWRPESEVRQKLQILWETMLDCMYRGCHNTNATLPGGLKVVRRASRIHDHLMGDALYSTPAEWLERLQARTFSFQEMVRWVSCFALAVNEENASYGRVVTAPTNGAAGVIPAVLMYYVSLHKADDDHIARFLMVAGEIGSLFKKGATISAAMGGCQAEIGVSSAMAAAALCECLGGSVEQTLMAAEIAMEHHLGLTCDPVGGLVQIPCIERNAMGAMKAITAASIALESQPQDAKVSLDAVIQTMWRTALDMNDKYKETSEGGLAMAISVNLAEC